MPMPKKENKKVVMGVYMRTELKDYLAKAGQKDQRSASSMASMVLENWYEECMEARNAKKRKSL